jgi:predicted aldo/keto reductase-like oxidoreductase
LALAYDLVEYGKMRYNLLGNGGHWFPGQKADKLAELDLTDCLKNSPYQDKIPQLLAETETLLGGTEVKRLSQS